MRGGLTGSVYVVTRYRVREGGVVEATTKSDCTEEFEALARIWATERGWRPPEQHTEGEGS